MIGLNAVEVGDIISFEYTGFMKKVSAKGKVMSINGAWNIAVTSAHTWAVKPANLKVLTLEKAK